MFSIRPPVLLRPPWRQADCARYEAAQELGEVSLMVTKHCVRFFL